MKFLIPSNEEIKPKNIYGFDIETINDTNDFLMGSIVGNGLKKIFFDKYEMIYFLMTHKPLRQNSYIIATNLGFDILGLFEETEYMKDVDFMLRGGKIIIANIKDGIRYYIQDNGMLKDTYRYKVTFLDTMNFVPYSVKKLGEIIGLKKLPYPKCLQHKRAPINNEEHLELLKYNIRDSEISKGFFEFLQRGYNSMGVNIKTTIASTSLSLYRNQYLDMKWKQPDKRVLLEQYKSYYGGKTETYKRGYCKKKLYYYDINNLYGKAMKEKYPNPNTLKITSKRKDFNYKMDVIEQFEGISYVEFIFDKKCYIPLLPYKDKDTKRLLFPTGNIKGYYTHIEIRKAINEGYKLKHIGYQQYYTSVFYPFKKYIETNYKEKLRCAKEKNPMELLYKLNNNTLYGKWAQKIHGKQQVIHMDNITPKLFKSYITNKNFKVEQVDDFLYITDLNGIQYPTFINPIMSIYTTAMARLIMYEYFKKNPNKVYYTDTDSLITEGKIRTSDKIGKMKLEHTIGEIIIVRPKTYGFITHDKKHCIVRSKGLPQIVVKEQDKKTLEEIAREKFNMFREMLNKRTVMYKKFVKFKESNRSNENGKHGKLKYNQVIDIHKTLDLEDTKRRWSKKFSLTELQDSKPIKIK